MPFDVNAIANPAVLSISPYQPGKPIEELTRETGITDIIKLASNENPLGASPKAIAAAEQAMANLHLYPDGGSYELKRALTKRFQLGSEFFTVGNGSENVLEIIAKAFLQPGDQAIVSQYAFATIPLVIKATGAEIVTVPAADWVANVEAMVQAITEKTKIIFLVNPNNPTGTYNTKAQFDYLLKNVPERILIVVDEAYAEYMTAKDYPNTLPYIKKHANLIISRTFSKIYGLAGLRVGYAIAKPEVSEVLNRARLPFNVNLLASAAAIAALEDANHVQKSLRINQKGMQQLLDGLKKLNLETIPSVCNFITVKFTDAKEVYDRLLKLGIIVRPLAGYGMKQYLRLTIGTEEQNERLLAGLEKVCTP